MNIIPVNNHLIIEPVKQESFVVRDREIYEEKGIVVGISARTTDNPDILNEWPDLGNVVYFDSWLAAKFPGEKEGEYFWLVNWADVKAIQRNESLPE